MQDDDSHARLIHRYFDESLSAEEEAELMASLEASAEQRRRFVEQAFLDSRLSEAMREDDIRSFIVSEENESLAELASDRRQDQRRSAFPLAFRAGLAAAALVAIALWSPRFAQKTGADSSDSGVRASIQTASQADKRRSKNSGIVESVGTLVQQRECKWEQAGAGWRNGDLLPPNTVLSLESGAAEVALENGVRLVLAGPCKVQLMTEMRGRVLHGSIIAKVPSNAHGFTLTTPSSKVIDLGTEFGVSVDASGNSEVHVFKGEVVSRWTGADRRLGQSVRLHQNDGARYGLTRSETTLISADETRFVRDLAPRFRPEELPPLPVHKNLALWLAADRMVETDAKGGVQSWSDLLCEPSQTFQVALQLDPVARPRLIPDAMNGRPAVRFDGVDDCLVTTPLETTDSQTIFVVLGLTNTTPAQGKIINYNGPPFRKLARFPTTPGVLQLNTRRYDEGAFRLSGFVYSGEHNAGYAIDSHARAIYPANATELNAPILVSYRYDPRANKAALHVNGRLVSEKTAPWPAGLTSRKVIGSHGVKDNRFLNADIAELIIYNEALPDRELGSVCQYLSKRYVDLSEKQGKTAD